MNTNADSSLRPTRNIYRREFVRQLGLWTAGLTLAPPLFRVVPRAIAAESAAPTLVCAKGTDYEALVAKVLEPLGGIGAFVKKGQKVVIKPNIAWDRNVDQAANTHPLVVKALVKLALGAGAAKVMVFDRTCNEERRCYANSGIQAAVQSVTDRRVSCTFVDDRKFVPVQIQKGKALTRWDFYKEALQADCYINVPIAKHHAKATLTLALKNIMGVIGGKRGELHDTLGQKIADLNTVLRPTLNVVDCTRILLRHGPLGGKLEDVKTLHTLLASPDPVAADAYATTFFDLAPDAVESTRAAAALGLGTMDLNRVKVVKV